MARRNTTVVVFGAVLVTAALTAVVVTWATLRHGFSARDQPTAIETFVARSARRLAIPAGARELRNPVAAGPKVLKDGRAHFADHCAICHANDGSGDTHIGRNLYPKAPDMRATPTQSLTDGELFYLIENGIRLTGMPAWGGPGTADDEQSWKLVHFIHHLPDLDDAELEEMKALNPKSAHERNEEAEIQRFLLGGQDAERSRHERAR